MFTTFRGGRVPGVPEQHITSSLRDLTEKSIPHLTLKEWNKRSLNWTNPL